MSKVRAYNPVLQFFNDDGSPMVGGHLETYKAGTSIPVTTYADESGTLNPVSIPLDSRGECTVFIVPGMKYKFVLKNKFGGVVWTADNYGSGGGGGGGGSSVPLVGVEIKSSGATKRFGDDGFVKNNPSNNQPSLYLPELGWWLFNVRLFLRNETARDLVQHITLEWDWNDCILEGVPPATYTALYPPSMQTDVDFTTTFTRQYGASTLIHKEAHTDHWLTVRPIVYGGTPLTDTEWAVTIDIFKVRDA